MAVIYENELGEITGYELESKEELQELIILFTRDYFNNI